MGRVVVDAASEAEEIKRVEEKLMAVLRTLNDHVFPLLERSRRAPNAEQAFDRAYDEDRLEKIIRLEAALDARISKVLARLASVLRSSSARQRPMRPA
jgi:hypothetical protein